jgi:hypothetical protein
VTDPKTPAHSTGGDGFDPACRRYAKQVCKAKRKRNRDLNWGYALCTGIADAVPRQFRSLGHGVRLLIASWMIQQRTSMSSSTTKTTGAMW